MFFNGKVSFVSAYKDSQERVHVQVKWNENQRKPLDCILSDKALSTLNGKKLSELPEQIQISGYVSFNGQLVITRVDIGTNQESGSQDFVFEDTSTSEKTNQKPQPKKNRKLTEFDVE